MIRELKESVEELRTAYIPYYGVGGVLRYAREKLGERVENLREYGLLATLRRKTHILPTEVEYEYEREERPSLLDRIKSKFLKSETAELEPEKEIQPEVKLEEVKEEVKETIPEHLKSSSAFKWFIQMKESKSSVPLQLRSGI